MRSHGRPYGGYLGEPGNQLPVGKSPPEDKQCPAVREVAVMSVVHTVNVRLRGRDLDALRARAKLEDRSMAKLAGIAILAYLATPHTELPGREVGT